MQEMVATVEGPGVPASLAFRRCPGCNDLFYEDAHACARCRYRYEVIRPTCTITYCIDCGWTLPVHNQHEAGRRCRKCLDLYNYNTHYMPSLLRYVEQVERPGRAGWDYPDTDSAILSWLNRSVWTGTERTPLARPHVCAIPTCGKPRIYCSRFCTNHDEDLNGPLRFIAMPGHRLTVGRCVYCRMPVASNSVRAVYVCPFHNVYAMDRWMATWVERLEQWAVNCPVCFRRFTDGFVQKAWDKYVEHHRLRHRPVALLA